MTIEGPTSLRVSSPLTELAVCAEQIAQLAIAPVSALVIENEITYLSVEGAGGRCGDLGKGLEVDRLGLLPLSARPFLINDPEAGATWGPVLVGLLPGAA